MESFCQPPAKWLITYAEPEWHFNLHRDLDRGVKYSFLTYSADFKCKSSKVCIPMVSGWIKEGLWMPNLQIPLNSSYDLALHSVCGTLIYILERKWSLGLYK